MKPIFLILLFLFAIRSTSFAQGPVMDTHPTATIFAIDYSTGQETQVTNGDAILFKDALIELVSNTTISKIQVKITPGHKTFTITQMNPETNGYAYQLVLQSKILGQTITVYTFLYNVDQNTLSYYDQQQQSWVPQMIQGFNVNNLNNTLAYSKFNNPQPEPDQSAQPAVDADANSNTPVDADVSVVTVPPDMPDYQQPECPQDGYLWQPGYWAYSRDTNGYYWVPGAWVAPPTNGLLWTPPYWGFDGGLYVFHSGYWGNTIGFYGGINYGYGYGGSGYYGGEWREGHFRYNTAVVRVNVNVIHNTYVDRNVIINRNVSRSSFNGRGGVMARPNANEMAAMHQQHISATSEQIRNQRIARADKSQFAAANGGRPANLAAEKVPVRNQNVNTGARVENAVVTGSRPGNPGVTGNVRNAIPGTPVIGSTRSASVNRPAITGAPSAPGAPGARTGAPGGGMGARTGMGNKKLPAPKPQKEPTKKS
jgi:hypothetical protein